MNTWNNILDEESLKSSIIFAALFVMNFECLKDFVVTQPREFLGEVCLKDGKIDIQNSESYKRVTSLDKNLENASLKWFIKLGAISNEDLDAICGLRRTVLRSKTDAMRSERTDLI